MASKKFFTHIDLNSNEIQNVVIQKLASDPGSPVEGQIWLNTTANKLRARINGVTKDIQGDIESISAGSSKVSVTNGNGPDVTIDVVVAQLINDSGTSSSDLWSASKIQSQIDQAVAGLDFQADVLDIQVDATLDPGASPTTGDRYLITNSASLHANFGTITGVADDDIVEYDGANFVVAYDVSTEGEGALVWDRASNTFQRYDGTAWTEFGGLSGVTAGTGLTKSGNTINAVGGDGIVVNADELEVDPDNVTVELSATDGNGKVRVKDGGISTAKIADDAVNAAKINSDVAGDGLTQNGGTGALDVDDASTTQKGKVELATQTETEGKTDATRSVTPAGLVTFVRQYQANFLTTDFSSNILTVTAATHGLGASKNLSVKVYEDGTPNTEVETEVKVADNGDVTVNVNSTFNGHIVIQGSGQ